MNINNKELNNLASEILGLIENLQSGVKVMLSENSPLHARYLAYSKLACIAQVNNAQLACFQALPIIGHHLSHDLFKSQEWQKEGWDNIDLSNVAFFEQESEEDGEEE